MTEQSRFLNAEEARQVREFVDQHSTNPPADADSILDDLDRSILKSEGLSTIETVNSLLTTRALEAQQKGESSSIPDKVLQSVRNDEADAENMDAIWAGFKEQAPLAELAKDGGQSFADAAYAEIMGAQKVVKGQREAAARERQATARRFNGFGYKVVTEKQFYRGKGKR